MNEVYWRDRPDGERVLAARDFVARGFNRDGHMTPEQRVAHECWVLSWPEFGGAGNVESGGNDGAMLMTWHSRERLQAELVGKASSVPVTGGDEAAAPAAEPSSRSAPARDDGGGDA
jgi:hypothetical protein